MIRLAIQGHNTRGKEVIEILEMLGGKTSYECSYKDGFDSSYFFFINTDENFSIDGLVYNNEELKNYYIFTLEEFLEKYPYKVGDKVIVKTLPEYPKTIKFMEWFDNSIYYSFDKETWFEADGIQPYKEKGTMEEPKQIPTYMDYDIRTEEIMEGTIKINIPKGYEFFGIDDDNKVVLTKKQPQYPKTYDECCKVLEINPDNYLSIRHLYYGDGDEDTTKYEQDLLNIFDSLWVLKICRDAYWKIAGEQMGLGKPWKPDWSIYEHKFCLGTDKDKVIEECVTTGNRILAFPTREMRDTFYENFKELIEETKELL